MLGLFGIHKTCQYGHFSWIFVIHLLLIFCDFGRAGIIVFDGSLDIEEFPDIELSNTQPIRRNGIEGVLVAANPLHACVNISKPPAINASLNWFVLISGNSCTFETKVRNAKSAGYSLGIIYTYRGRIDTPSSYGHYLPGFYSDMPAVVVKTEHGLKMKDYYLFNINMRYRFVVFPNNSFSIMTFLLLFSIVAGLFLVVMLSFTVIRFFQQSNATLNGRLTSQHLRQLQMVTFKKGDPYETCAICLEDYKEQDKLRILPCSHDYHTKCIDPWLTNSRRICPVCKRKVLLAGEPSDNIASTDFVERSETTPLLQAGSINPHGTFSSAATAAAVNPNNVLDAGQSAEGVSERHDEQHVVSFLQL